MRTTWQRRWCWFLVVVLHRFLDRQGITPENFVNEFDLQQLSNFGPLRDEYTQIVQRVIQFLRSTGCRDYLVNHVYMDSRDYPPTTYRVSTRVNMHNDGLFRLQMSIFAARAQC